MKERMVALVFCASVVAGASAHGQSRETMYRQLSALNFGSIEVVKPKIDVIAIRRWKKTGTTTVDEIQSLDLSAGTVAIRHDGRVVLQGSIAAGSQADPAFHVEGGRVTWRGGIATSAEVDRLTMRLVKTTIYASTGGTIEIPATVTVLADSAGTRLLPDAAGKVRLTIPVMVLRRQHIQWADLAFETDLRSAAISQAEIDLATGDVRIRETTLRATTARVAFQKPVTTFLPDFQLDGPGSGTLEQLQLTRDGDAVRLSATSATLSPAGLTRVTPDNTRVASSAEVKMSKLASKSGTWDVDSLSLPAPTAAFAVHGNATVAVNLLNLYGPLHPDDYLIPLGNSHVRFVRLSALASLYETTAAIAHARKVNADPTVSTSTAASAADAAAPSPEPAPTPYGAKLHIAGDTVARIEPLTAPAREIEPLIRREDAEFIIDMVTGIGGPSILENAFKVTWLEKSLVTNPSAVGLTANLLASRLHPRFGVPMFITAYAATKIFNVGGKWYIKAGAAASEACMATPDCAFEAVFVRTGLVKGPAHVPYVAPKNSDGYSSLDGAIAAAYERARALPRRTPPPSERPSVNILRRELDTRISYIDVCEARLPYLQGVQTQQSAAVAAAIQTYEQQRAAQLQALAAQNNATSGAVYQRYLEDYQKTGAPLPATPSPLQTPPDQQRWRGTIEPYVPPPRP